MKRVYLEITDACNLRCPFCTYDKGDHFMSFDEIKDYISQIKAFCDYIYLHILGEPLLHPDLEKILDLLDEKQMKLQLVTNGTLLYRYPDLLDHPCLRKLSISLHSYDHSNKDERYFKVIDDLIENNKNKAIELRFYKSDSLSKTLRDYKDTLIKTYGLHETKRKNSYLLKDKIYLYEEEMFDWPKMSDPFISDMGTCHGGIDMIAINHDGKVSLCCLDPIPSNLIGDLKKESLAQILKSETYNKTIEDLKKHKLDMELCKRCTYRLRF